MDLELLKSYIGKHANIEMSGIFGSYFQMAAGEIEKNMITSQFYLFAFRDTKCVSNIILQTFAL